MNRCILPLAALLFLSACQVPQFGSGRSGLQVHVGSTSSRTVLTDPSLLVYDGFRATLTSTSGQPSRTQTSSSSTLLFGDVELGTYDVVVSGLIQGRVAATGVAKGIVLSGGATQSVTVTLSLGRTAGGTGGYRLPVTIPKETGIDTVVTQLRTSEGILQGVGQTVALQDSGSSAFATVEDLAVPSGAYVLTLDFRRGGAAGTSAGLFSEAVNVWDNVVSDRWVDPTDGHLAAGRTFGAGEFFTMDASVTNLRLNHHGPSLEMAPAFSSLVTDYTIAADPDPSSSFSLFWDNSIPGESAAWGLGATPTWTDLGPATSVSLNLAAGLSLVQLRITAPDRATTRTYRFQIDWSPDQTPVLPVAGFRAIAGDGAIRFVWDAPTSGTVRATTSLGGWIPDSTSPTDAVWLSAGEPTGTPVTASAVHTDAYGRQSSAVEATGTTSQAVDVAQIRTMGPARGSQSAYSQLTAYPDGGLLVKWNLSGGPYDFGGLRSTVPARSVGTVLVHLAPDGSGLWLVDDDTTWSLSSSTALPDGGAMLVGNARDHAMVAGFDSGPGDTGFLARLGPTGAVEWLIKSPGASPYSVAVSPVGLLAVVGTMQPGTTSLFGHSLAAGAPYQGFILELQFDGTPLRQLDSSTSHSIPALVDFDPSGRLWVAGTQTVDLVDQDGNLLWTASLPPWDLWSTSSLAIGADGSAVVAGSGKVGTDWWGWMGRLTPQGTWAWRKEFPSGSPGTPFLMADGSVYLAGCVGRLFSLDDALAHPYTPNGGALLAKLSSEGKGLWAVTNTKHHELYWYNSFVQAADGSLWAGGSLRDNGGYAPVLVQYRP